MITSPYHLPFPVFLGHEPLFVGGGTIEVVVRAAGAMTTDAADVLSGALRQFSILAELGALGGTAIDPSLSSQTFGEQEGADDQVLTWTFADCWLDERAVMVLVEVLFFAHALHPIARVEVRRRDLPSGALRPMREQPGEEAEYPGVYRKVPFSVEVDEDRGESLLLRVGFRHPATSEQVDAVDGAIVTWGAAVGMGAYGVPPAAPVACGLTPDQSITPFEQEFEWSAQRVRCHPAAISGLVNALCVVDQDIAPIAWATIE